MKSFCNFATGLTLCLAIAGPAAAQDAAHGQVLFSAECAACHSTVPGQNGVGPSLAGVYGSRAGMVPGYKFSVALKQSTIVWTSETLEAFLTDPNSDVTGTNMPLPGTVMHLGMPNATDRADVIAYLRTLKQ